MLTPRTHLGISHALCGAPTELAEGRATTRFVATPEMAADDRGLVHGGFVFGLAAHAAMLAVNDPFVVLGSSEVRFVAPVRVGDEVIAHAEIARCSSARSPRSCSRNTCSTARDVGVPPEAPE